jgi:predicted DNA-binding transcriptional regulator AlpA
MNVTRLVIRTRSIMLVDTINPTHFIGANRVARQLGLSYATVLAASSRGELPPLYRVGGRRFRQTDIERWLASGCKPWRQLKTGRKQTAAGERLTTSREEGAGRE